MQTDPSTPPQKEEKTFRQALELLIPLAKSLGGIIILDVPVSYAQEMRDKREARRPGTTIDFRPEDGSWWMEFDEVRFYVEPRIHKPETKKP